ncbi:MAG: sn-glycerol-3-phosphate ABC transporter ATP-binding protein UgpC [Bacteroides sp.]|nr:sn-glycerol-3-phosphate ABC transporter ATP-binding protein UgpC [Bacteroides sp.]
MAYLTLRGINKIYPNGFHAVHDFNLEIEKGEFIVFVGSSGCGKSTTLRMIAGLENISNGDFYIDGVRANEKGPRERGVAMVFQSYALYPHMSVYDNLAFGLMLQGVDEDVIDKKVMNTAKILGLTDYLDRKPRALSGGQRQRVAVGRAIIRKVDIFLMDEPLSNLDAKQRVTMRSEITQIHRETGATTIYVTHDQTEAMTMADRIVVMKAGYIQQVGTPHSLYFNPVNMFVAGFIGEPPMNFIEETLKGGKLDIRGNIVDLNAVADKSVLQKYEGKTVALGFRPEAIKLAGKEDVSNAYKIACKVELTELLGDNTNVYVDINGVKSILKVDPHDSPEMDADLVFAIPYESVYLFDKETEKRIHLKEKDAGSKRKNK